MAANGRVGEGRAHLQVGRLDREGRRLPRQARDPGQRQAHRCLYVLDIYRLTLVAVDLDWVEFEVYRLSLILVILLSAWEDENLVESAGHGHLGKFVEH